MYSSVFSTKSCIRSRLPEMTALRRSYSDSVCLRVSVKLAIIAVSTSSNWSPSAVSSFSTMSSFELRMRRMLSKHMARDSSSSVSRFCAKMSAFLAADCALNRLVSALLPLCRNYSLMMSCWVSSYPWLSSSPGRSYTWPGPLFIASYYTAIYSGDYPSASSSRPSRSTGRPLRYSRLGMRRMMRSTWSSVYRFT